MIVKFDKLNRFEKPIMTLCSPGSIYNNGILTNTIGILNDTSDEELVLNFNATSELNFRVYKISRETGEVNQYTYKLFTSLQNRRMIFVEGIGYFIITSVDDGFSPDRGDFKDISAKSCDIEMQNKKVPYIENGTYQFNTLLETVVSSLPMWTIAYVDGTVSEKYRTFEDISEELNVLGFLLDNMQTAYECIFIFDTIHRRISVYSQDNYLEMTDIHLTKDDVVQSINVSETSDDLYTALSIFGGEQLFITPVNPLGTNTIYNFDYYLDWMSPQLQARVIEWQTLIKSHFDNYYTLNQTYYEYMEQASFQQSEINRLEILKGLYERCKENIIAENDTGIAVEYNEVIVNDYKGTAIDISGTIETTLQQITSLINGVISKLNTASSVLATTQNQITPLKEKITNINNEVNISAFFTQSEYDELSNYIFEGTYTDEYVIVTDSMTYEERFTQMKTLYDRAINQLSKISQPTQEFSIDVESFVFLERFARHTEQLKTGSIITVELNDETPAQLFLSSITLNYFDETLSLKFGNRYNKFDLKSLYENVLGNIQKSANSINYIKDVIYPIKNGQLDTMEQMLQNSRNLAKDIALSATDQEVIIDDSGYTGRKKSGDGYDPHQVKIVGSNIVFTEDAWESASLALGLIQIGDTICYGINSDALIGNIIIGRQLHIVDADGKDIFSITDDKIASSIRGVDGRLTALEQDANSFNIQLQNGVQSVTTTTGYTFNHDGLSIKQSNSDIINKINESGMYVVRSVGDSETEILSAGTSGVNALNLTARQYLLIGSNCVFEDYGNNNERTACYYIG